MALKTRKGRTTSDAADVSKAIARGKSRARSALAVRAEQREKRARSVAVASRAIKPAAAPIIPARTLASLGPRATAGVLIAEGDSWFNYPLHDVLQMLEDEHGFDVESVAHKGDRVEDMAFADGQLEEFSRRLEKLLRNGVVPRAILLSGGGNDLAGSEFGMLLNHAASPIAGLNDDIVTGVIDKRIKIAYVTVVAAITAICEKFLSRSIPIVTHGYDYPVPDGRGFLGGFLALPGPWLQPGFREKGFDDLDKNTAMMETLIDRFNTMLKSAAGEFPHVHYLDLRKTLRNDARYKVAWANELHPTSAGFKLVAEKFAAVIAGLS
jgi:lysophospholipase L1-like esterase